MFSLLLKPQTLAASLSLRNHHMIVGVVYTNLTTPPFLLSYLIMMKTFRGKSHMTL
jgi:hypothetical protein